MMEIVVHNDLVFEFTRVAPITFFLGIWQERCVLISLKEQDKGSRVAGRPVVTLDGVYCSRSH